MDWEETYVKVPLKKIPWHTEKPPASLVRNIDGIRRGPALDICCGAGTNTIFLAKQGFAATGIDISETAVKIASERAEKEGVKADFVAGDVMEFDFKQRFSFILDRACFHHMDFSRRHEFSQKMSDLLEEGGSFQLMAFSDRNKFDKSLTKEQIHEYFSRHFEIGDIEEVLHLEPDGRKIYLYDTIMKKKGDSP